MNITFIGMPGSGKSFIGKKVAEQLGFTLIDTDKIIGEEYNLPLPHIVEKLGSKKFLDKEETTVMNIPAQNNLAISPGGSVIYRPRAMEQLKRISKVFYLEVRLEVLKERIGNVPRGIVIDENKTFADLYIERIPFYEKYADYRINGDANPEGVVNEVLSVVRALMSHRER